MRQARKETRRVGDVRRGRRLGAALAAIALLAFAARAALATHSTSTIGLLAIDANSEGNAAASLGALNGCSRLEPGAEVTVDYVVDSIPQDRPMIAFEAEVRYDPQLVEVVAADYRLLLASVGAHTPLAARSDEPPDSDGNFLMSVLDTASMTDPEANVERGPGVLARLTFRAKAAGIAALELVVSREPLVYPVVLDTQNELIFADRIGSASLAIGQDCPVEAQEPIITDLTEVNEQILADNPELQGATTTPGGATPAASPGADLTPEGQTPAPGTTGPPSPTTVPCAAPPLRTPVDISSTSPQPPTGVETPLGATASPTPAEPACTPTPTPIPDQIAGLDEGSNTPLIAALALLTLGPATAGGGLYLYRRSRLARDSV